MSQAVPSQVISDEADKKLLVLTCNRDTDSVYTCISKSIEAFFRSPKRHVFRIGTREVG